MLQTMLQTKVGEEHKRHADKAQSLLCILARTLSLFALGLFLCTGAAMAAQGKSAYVGNPKSGIYHNSSCRYFSCKACTVPLASPQEAKSKGFRACKVCRG